MENIDASHLLHPFTVRIWIQANPRDVQLGWTQSALITRWFVNKAQYLDSNGFEIPDAAPGCTLLWTWLDGAVEKSAVHENTDGVFRFGWYQNMGEVEVKFSGSNGGTLVELRQSMSDRVEPQPRLGAQIGSRMGWTFFLCNLKSVIEGGKDLRETDPTRQGVLNV